MGAKKAKDPNAGTPFEEIEKDFDTAITPQDLKLKVLEFDINRNSERELVNGKAYLCDLKTNILAKGIFRNLSTDGVRFETPPVEVKTNKEIFVNFLGILNLGLVHCTVQWIKEIEGHKYHHRMIGLKFKKLSAMKKKRILEYIAQLQISRKNDPFIL